MISLLAATILPIATKAQTAPPGEWRLHNTWHRFHKKIFDTPDKVYHLALGLGYFSWSGSYNVEYPILFVYDKKEDVIEGYNGKNYLHGNVIKDMWYNAAKKYFLVVYDDFNIDILYTDDRCYNVPGLASAIVPGTKEINSVTFDPENNRAYVATKFGYLVIDDNKNVITESHVYGVDINSVARVGNYLVAGRSDGLYKSDLKRNDKHNSWNSFSKVASGPTAVKNILTQTGNDFLYIDNTDHLFKGVIDADGNITFDGKDIANTNITRFHETKDGYFMATGWEGILVDRNGNKQNIPGTSTYRNDVYTASMDQLWRPIDEQGLEKLTYKDGTWTSTPSPTYGKYIKPDAPGVYDAAAFDYSPKYGMMASNAPYAHYHGNFDTGYFVILSTYKNGEWSSQTPYYLAGNKTWLIDNHTAVFDPAEEDIVWVGSGNNRGLAKYNIDNHSSKQFYAGGSAWNSNIQTPKFDADGTLWTFRQNPSVFYYWKKEDRLKEDASKLKALKTIDNYGSGAFPIFIPCTAEGNKSFLIISRGTYGSGLFVYDHRGTLEDTSDDRTVSFESLRDQDGQAINVTYVYSMMEDPATGRVWVGGDGGLYWFNPKEAFNSDFHVNRVKVARNDGTGLADYLLEGSSIFSMGIDGAGHKWFGTLGNGVVETSASGSELIRQLTTDNSYLPSNDVIAIGFEPDSNCVWLGTKKGIAQYYSETAPGAEKLDDVLAYPNPVRPDYYGHVTIKGLMDGSLVKILDASGGLVRELGRSEGGMMLWDLTNMGGHRVPTGVYYVATSTSGDSSEANVAKILVMN